MPADRCYVVFLSSIHCDLDLGELLRRRVQLLFSKGIDGVLDFCDHFIPILFAACYEQIDFVGA